LPPTKREEDNIFNTRSPNQPPAKIFGGFFGKLNLPVKLDCSLTILQTNFFQHTTYPVLLNVRQQHDAGG
jgi:hypothetical protein